MAYGLKNLLGIGAGSIGSNLAQGWGGLVGSIGDGFSNMGDSLFGAGGQDAILKNGTTWETLGDNLSQMGTEGNWAGQADYLADSLSSSGSPAVTGLFNQASGALGSKEGKNWMDTGISAFGGFNDYKNSKMMKNSLEQENNRANVNQAWTNQYAANDLAKQERQRNFRY